MNKTLATWLGVIVVFLIMMISSCDFEEVGKASYYSDKLHGKPTASGEPYDRTELTAAHRELDFGTKVRVTYPETGKSAVDPLSGPEIIIRGT